MTDKYTLFWNGPFSQWHPSDFEINSIKFNCAEQFMMVYKAILFKDYKSAEAIMKSDNPREQKTIGRKVKGFDIPTWSGVARDIVKAGSIAKFTQNPELCVELINTYPTTLVEASPYDRIWGIGLSEYHPDAKIRSKWQGKNWLGEVLTQTRDAIMGGYTHSFACHDIIRSLNNEWPR